MLEKSREQNPYMEEKYWNNRYELGGTSGPGSISINRDWKWKIIQKYCNDPNDIIDVGCGDLSFWDGKNCANYIGIDISESYIEMTKQRLNKG